MLEQQRVKLFTSLWCFRRTATRTLRLQAVFVSFRMGQLDVLVCQTTPQSLDHALVFIEDYIISDRSVELS